MTLDKLFRCNNFDNFDTDKCVCDIFEINTEIKCIIVNELLDNDTLSAKRISLNIIKRIVNAYLPFWCTNRLQLMYNICRRLRSLDYMVDLDPSSYIVLKNDKIHVIVMQYLHFMKYCNDTPLFE